MVLARYREVLSLPGALRFSLTGIIARAPMSMVGISLILAVRGLYHSYALAGLLGAAQVVAFAVGAPILARLVDRYGQAQVMFPSVTISTLALIAGTIGVMNVVNPLYLAVFSIIGGATSGSLGALVRARWAYVVENPSQLQAAYAMEAAFDELVFVLGPVAATILAATVHPAAGLWVAIVIQTVGVYSFLAQTSTQPPKEPPHEGKRRESVMRNAGMIVLASTFISTGALFGAMDLSVVAFADEVDLSHLAGIVLATMSLGSLVSAVFYGSRSWSWPLWKLFITWVALLAIGVSPFLLAPNLLVLGIMMFIAGLAIAPVMTNGNTIVQRITPAARLTEGLTWMSTATTLGVSLGSALAGPLIDSRGHSGGFTVTLIFGWTMVIAALIGVKALRRSLEKAEEHRPHITEDGHVEYPEAETGEEGSPA